MTFKGEAGTSSSANVINGSQGHIERKQPRSRHQRRHDAQRSEPVRGAQAALLRGLLQRGPPEGLPAPAGPAGPRQAVPQVRAVPVRPTSSRFTELRGFLRATHRHFVESEGTEMLSRCNFNSSVFDLIRNVSKSRNVVPLLSAVVCEVIVVVYLCL